MRRCLIAYDISECRARDAMARKLEKAGRRIQKSVFVVESSEGALARLERELHDLLGPEDSLLVLPVCAACQGNARIYGHLPPLLLIVR